MLLNKKRSKNKIVIVASAVLVCIVVAAGYVTFAALHELPPFASTEKTYNPGEHVTNLERSQAEKDAEKTLLENPDQKTQNSQNDTPETPSEQTSSGKTEVNVLITNARTANGTVSASGFVTNITESGGTCTYTFTSGSLSLSKSAQTLVNPTSTTCETVSFPADELAIDGVWRVVLSYSSNSAAGESQPKEFTK